MHVPAYLASLKRMLLGHRIRRAQRVWVISSVSMATTGQLRLEVAGFPAQPILVDMPSAFDARSNDHIVWLLGLIQHTLVEEFSEALAEVPS